MEIEHMYLRRLMGLRRLPKYERPAALRAARNWRRLAMRALRERQAAERHARRLARRSRAKAISW
jgi:hypothetical protein